MQLFLLRHGHAEAHAAADNLRPLSAQGELELHKVCQQKCDELRELELILFSPYLRTRQSADILSQYSPAPQRELAALVPNADPRVLIEKLYELSEHHQRIAVVSHQPLLGIVLDELGGFDCGRYRMGTAALAQLSCDPLAAACCQLNWLAHP
ncbi:phosphohistidine phosphatase SixA [Agaribacterium haliotis]|uniref:phosphohistidine phosphatase SixA n=1 Tax=Agaribacterium haliotis TaxID=2013869 RepID=UPI000BB59641|nr:phosphohistidine phosphatase SixA [Agaribacterium haliotis]